MESVKKKKKDTKMQTPQLYNSAHLLSRTEKYVFGRLLCYCGKGVQIGLSLVGY